MRYAQQIRHRNTTDNDAVKTFRRPLKPSEHARRLALKLGIGHNSDSSRWDGVMVVTTYDTTRFTVLR